MPPNIGVVNHKSLLGWIHNRINLPIIRQRMICNVQKQIVGQGVEGLKYISLPLGRRHIIFLHDVDFHLRLE